MLRILKVKFILSVFAFFGGMSNAAFAVNIPSLESGNIGAYCSEQWTKRGVLDQSMYQFCMKLEREGYANLKTKNESMNIVAASCPVRLPQASNVKTLKEIGIDAPYIFNIVIAQKQMTEARRKAIGIILHNATTQLGEKETFNLSAIRPSQFDGLTAEEFYSKSIEQVKRLQTKYREQINKAQGK
jgi:hypothetical protein